jgi:hypothetical protein
MQSGANASNRVIVSGGVRFRVSSQEAHCESDVVDASVRSSSTPGSIGKANSERVGQAQSRGAVAPRAPSASRPLDSGFINRAWRKIAACIAIAAVFGLRADLECGIMVMGDISAVSCGTGLRPMASLRLALHVSGMQSGANASNRVIVSGGVRFRVSSQEAHCESDVVDASSSRWSGRINTSVRADVL